MFKFAIIALTFGKWITFEKATASCPDQSLYDANSYAPDRRVAAHPCLT